jgi:hypothetical protein
VILPSFTVVLFTEKSLSATPTAEAVTTALLNTEKHITKQRKKDIALFKNIPPFKFKKTLFYITVPPITRELPHY